MAKIDTAVLYVDANKAYFYGSNTKTTLQMDFSIDTLLYLDVVNSDKLQEIIQSFVTINKIQPASIFLVLSPYATYEKEITAKSSDEKEAEVQKFVSTVPYEHVQHRIYKLQDKEKVFAVNQDVYESLKRGFEKLQFPVVSVVPFGLLQNLFPDIGTTIHLEIIASKFEAAKQYSLITSEENMNTTKQNSAEKNTNKPNPLRLYGLIGLFVVLVGLLLFMIMTSMQPQKPVATERIYTPTIVPPQTPTSIPTLIPSLPQTEAGTTSGRLLTPTAVLKK